MVSIIIVMMIIAYLNYVYLIMFPKYSGKLKLDLEDKFSYAHLVIFHINFILLVWSFL